MKLEKEEATPSGQCKHIGRVVVDLITSRGVIPFACNFIADIVAMRFSLRNEMQTREGTMFAQMFHVTIRYSQARLEWTSSQTIVTVDSSKVHRGYDDNIIVIKQEIINWNRINETA